MAEKEGQLFELEYPNMSHCLVTSHVIGTLCSFFPASSNNDWMPGDYNAVVTCKGQGLSIKAE